MSRTMRNQPFPAILIMNAIVSTTIMIAVMMTIEPFSELAMKYSKVLF